MVDPSHPQYPLGPIRNIGPNGGPSRPKWSLSLICYCHIFQLCRRKFWLKTTSDLQILIFLSFLLVGPENYHELHFKELILFGALGQRLVKNSQPRKVVQQKSAAGDALAALSLGCAMAHRWDHVTPLPRSSNGQLHEPLVCPGMVFLGANSLFDFPTRIICLSIMYPPSLLLFHNFPAG